MTDWAKETKLMMNYYSFSWQKRNVTILLSISTTKKTTEGIRKDNNNDANGSYTQTTRICVLPSLSLSLSHSFPPIFFCTISQKRTETAVGERRKRKNSCMQNIKTFISYQFDARNNRNRCRRQTNLVPVKLFIKLFYFCEKISDWLYIIVQLYMQMLK